MKPFRHFAALAAGASLAALAAASPALATTWYPVSDFVVPTQNIPASASPGALYNLSGWTDLAGSVSSVTPSNYLNLKYVSNPWINAIVVRPAAENAADGQLAIRFTAVTSSASAGSIFGAGLRLTNTGTGTESGYLVVANEQNSNGTTVLQIYKIASGSLTQLTSASIGTLTAGTDYILYSSVSGTTISASVTDTSANLIGSAVTTTDSTFSGAGQMGVYSASGGSSVPTNIKELSTQTDVANSATAYQVFAPAMGIVGQASTVTYGLNGSTTSGFTVSPSAQDGNFSASALNLAAATPDQTLTYTPATTGSKTLTGANNGTSITNGSAAMNVLVNIPLSSSAYHPSPANWTCWKTVPCVSGGTYPRAWPAGAYFTAHWSSGTSPQAVLQFAPNSGADRISYILDGTLTDNVPASGNITLSPSASATHTLAVYVRCATDCVLGDITSRYGSNALNNVTFQGLAIDGASTPLTGVLPNGTPVGADDMTASRCWVDWRAGDSINEGYLVDGSGTSNFLHTSTYAMMQQMFARGCDVGMNASIGDGFLPPGNGNVPPLYYVDSGGYEDQYSRWNKRDMGVTALDSAGHLSAYNVVGQDPTIEMMNFGTNDAGNYNATGATNSYCQVACALPMNMDSYETPAVTGFLQAARKAAPAAKIVFEPGFPVVRGTINANYPKVLAQLNAGVSAYGADPALNYTYDLNTINIMYSNGTTYVTDTSTHPNVLGNLLDGPMLLGPIVKGLSPTSGTVRYTPLH